MSASQFPLCRASAVTPEQPTVNATELLHVAHALRRIELLVNLVVHPLLPAGNALEVLQAAREHVAGLVAYTQPWFEICDWPADSWPSPWRP